MKKLDSNNNGTVDYNEFLVATQDWINILQKKELELTLKIYDTAGGGTLSIEELKQAIPGINDSEWEKLLS